VDKEGVRMSSDEMIQEIYDKMNNLVKEVDELKKQVERHRGELDGIRMSSLKLSSAIHIMADDVYDKNKKADEMSYEQLHYRCLESRVKAMEAEVKLLSVQMNREDFVKKDFCEPPALS
jgi:predicted nuclease with TOPRIM domain